MEDVTMVYHCQNAIKTDFHPYFMRGRNKQ